MLRLIRLGALLLSTAGILVCSGRASAQPAAPIELKWSVLEGCPSSETVLARVRRIAGPIPQAAKPLRAQATVTQGSDGLFRMRLEIQSGELAAARNIEGKSCKDLAGAAAVALALLLSSAEPLSEQDLEGNAEPTSSKTDPNNPGNQAAQQTTAATQVTPPPKTTQVAGGSTSTPDENTAESERRWRVLLVAPFAAVSFDPWRQTSRALGVAAGFSFDRWRFLADGKLWASERETLNRPGVEYDVELKRVSVSARGCRSYLGPTLELSPCVLMSVHHIGVRGGGPNIVSHRDTVTWAAVGIGAQARLFVLPWVSLVAGVDAELQLSRPEVTLALPQSGSTDPTANSVERFGPVAVTLSVGPQWIF